MEIDWKGVGRIHHLHDPQRFEHPSLSIDSANEPEHFTSLLDLGDPSSSRNSGAGERSSNVPDRARVPIREPA
ncbi:MAG TPA: hypothetical protein VFQ39_11940, partial [Longimicrobium sp.]|nr:hypothetical protein [Longimicrobium sp.]